MPRRNEIHHSRAAFTLIEVLIAIALVLTLVGAMYGFLFDMLASRSRVLEQVWQETAASALIKQLDADLSTCVVGDRSVGGGVVGSEQRLRVLSRSVAATLAGRGVDDSEAFGDLQFSEYRFNASLKRIEGRKGAAGRSGSATPDFSVIEGVIHKVRFRYHDGESWHDSFDSLAMNHLPAAVEVSIWYRPLPTEAELEPGQFAAEQPVTVAHDADSPAGPAKTVSAPRNGIDPPPDRVRVFVIYDAASDGRAGSTAESRDERTTP